MPKVLDGQQNTENQKALPDVVGSKKQVSYRTEIIGGVPIVTPTQVNPPPAETIFLTDPSSAVSRVPISFVAQHEGSDCADRAECEAMQRSHSQLPYFLGRPAQEHAVIKSGYCVKQGAVVSTRTCWPLGLVLLRLILVIIPNLLFSDEELEAAIFPAGRKRDELLQIRFGNYVSVPMGDVLPGLRLWLRLVPMLSGSKSVNAAFQVLILPLVICFFGIQRLPFTCPVMPCFPPLLFVCAPAGFPVMMHTAWLPALPLFNSCTARYRRQVGFLFRDSSSQKSRAL